MVVRRKLSHSLALAVRAVVEGLECRQLLSADPSIIVSSPAAGSTGVALDAALTADLNLPNGGLSAATVNTANVLLYRTSDHLPVTAVVNTSGGGDSVVLTPTADLQPNTQYTFAVTSGVQDVNGDPLVPYQITFTTGTATSHPDPSLGFQQVSLPTAAHAPFTNVLMGPDGKLYASTEDGRMFMFPVNADGTLGTPTISTALQQLNGAAKRIITGFAFDPRSTAANPIVWVSNSYYGFTNVPDWTGKITVMSGAGLPTAQDAVVNLPRSFQDHGTEAPAFGPDGALYFAQGSDTAMGAPDTTWGLRSEHMLTAAILRLDTTKVTPGQPLNVMTSDAGGPYNPFAPGAPLTVYATGVRNAYSVLWTQDGTLYAPTNGSSAGGNTPAFPNSVNGPRIDTGAPYNGPAVPGLNNVPESEIDWLFNVHQGKYYGHPNPARGEFVLDDGNPGNTTDPNVIPQYPVGTQPDPNYGGYAFDFGQHRSPDGILEYQDRTFGGKLQGMLLVSEYSAGDDIVALQRGANGAITGSMHGIPGLTDLNGPLGITEDTRNGNVYVAELGGSNITLLRPIAPAPKIAASASVLAFSDIARGYAGSGAPSHTDTLTITNTGNQTLSFPAGAFTIGKDPADASDESSAFAIANVSALPTSLAPGQSANVQLTYTAGVVGLQLAQLTIASNDPSTPRITIPLRGIGTSGVGGANEPSLARILAAFDIPTNVGEPYNQSSTFYPNPVPATSQEVPMQRLARAGAGPVTITTLASFVNSNQPALRMGYYTPGDPTDRTELFTENQGDAQTVNPTPVGATTFDPGSAPFGLYVNFPTFTDNGHTRLSYSEDALNTWDANVPRKMRFFPLENPDGSLVPNAYVFIAEDYNLQYDSNDIVGIIRNVKPAADAVGSPVLGLENLDAVPATTRLVFNRIQIPNATATDYVHDTDTLRIHNTGDQPLSITGLNLSDTTNWQIVSPTSFPAVVPVGGTLDVTIKFIATSAPPHSLNETNDYATQEALSPQQASGVWNGTLTIVSNDPVNPTRTVQLAGYWQHHSEYEEEPGLQTLTNLIFGYGTDISNAQQPEYPNNGKTRVLYGEEVYSPYWNVADPTQQVSVRQLDAFHNQVFNGQLTIAQVGWYPQGGSVRTLFVQQQQHSQELFPTAFNSNTTPAYATFGSSGSFGFYIDGEHSDDALNTTDINTYGRSGHSMRFYPVRDAQGNLVPNTWLLAMDYENSTFDNSDFQDIVLLISNIRPAAQPPAPTDVFATGTSGGVSLQWAASAYAGAQYNVYRAASPGGPYFKLNGQPLAQPGYLDASAPGGLPAYYRVTAVDPNSGAESPGTSASAVSAGTASSPPAAPANLHAAASGSGITITWNANAENNLAGYNVLRATSASGPFAQLNKTLLSGTSFTDTTAPTNVVSYYEVIAVNTLNQASAPSTTSATRPAGAPATSIYAPTAAPAVGNQNVYDPTIAPTGGVELGMKFTSDLPGAITGVRFYKGSLNAGAHTGELWSAAGQLLASVTFTSETASGWQQANFASPVQITPGATYVISYQDTSGYLAYTGGALASSIDNYPLHALASSASGGNGVYANDTSPGKPVFPNVYNGNASSYWVDVVFAPASAAVPPSAPGALAADGSKPTQVTLTWSPSSGTVTAYHVERSTDGINFTEIAANVQGDSYTDTTAQPGTSYSYRVRAENSGAFSVYSSPQQVTTVPAAPSALTITGTTANSVSLTWNASSGATAYDVVREAAGESSFQQVGTTTTTSFTDAVLPNTSYQYEVLAVDATGAGPASNAASATTPPSTTPPAEPADLAASVGTGGITLTWNANAEPDLVGYNVLSATSPAGPFAQLNRAPLTSPTYTDATAQPNVTKYYEVVAVNTSGLSSAPATISATLPFGEITDTLFASSAAPAASLQNVFDSVAKSHGGVELGMKFTSDLPGAITGVRFYKGSLNAGAHTGELWSAAGQLLASVTFTSETASGWQQANFASPVQITPGATYVISYQDTSGYVSYTGGALASGINAGPLHAPAAGTAGGNDVYGMDLTPGVPSFPTSYNGQAPNYWVDVAFTPGSAAPAPTAPTGLTAVAGTNGQVALNWGASTGTVTAYHVERSNDGVNFTDIAPNVQGTSFTDTTAQAGQTYTYAVRAENAGSFSPNSNVQQVTLAPAAPSNLGVAGTLPNSVSITWSAAPGATSYQMLRMGPSDASFVLVSTVTGTRFTDTNVQPSTSYQYEVLAVNAAGPSPTAAGPVTAVTPAPSVAPAMPANLTATASASAIMLAWSANAEPNLAGYNVLRGTSAAGPFAQLNATLLTTPAYTDSTAPAGVTEFYEVVAVNTSSQSSAPATASATVPATGPALTIFGASSAPAAAVQNINDPGVKSHGGLELGMKFTSDVAGSVTGVRFYKGTLNVGPHSGELWSASGQLLATATFTSETASGWQQVNFSNPVAIAANTVYVVSYQQDSGYLSYTAGALVPSINNGPLHAPASSAVGGNDVYSYDNVAGTPVFPGAYNGHSANYWVDVVFTPSSTVAPAPSTPGTLTATATSSTQVALAWGASTGTVTAYHVERSTDGVHFVEIASVAGTSYADGGLQASTTYTYRVRAENAGTFSGYDSATTLTTPAAPSLLASADIGASVPGSTSVITNGSDYDVTAGGPAMYGTSDGFRFVYEQVSGNFDVKVRLNSITTDAGIDQAGLMVRQSLDPSSPEVAVTVSPEGGYRFKYRLTSGGLTTPANTVASGSFPNQWVRLQRVGNSLTGYVGSDGTTWTSIGSITLAMTDPVYLGLAAAANSSSGTITAQFRSFGPT